MLPHIQDLYVREIKLQCFLAFMATNAVDALGNQLSAGGPTKEPNTLVFDTFRNLHSFLTHIGNISKLFWPAVYPQPPTNQDKLQKWQRTVDRASFLRNLYGIDDNHGLANRELRNNLEHFDERLDGFAIGFEGANHPDSGFGDMIFGPVPIMANGQPVPFLLRRFDREDGIKFQFINQTFDLIALSEATKEVFQKSDQLLGSAPN